MIPQTKSWWNFDSAIFNWFYR